MNKRSDVTSHFSSILIFSAHLWAGLSVGPFLPFALFPSAHLHGMSPRIGLALQSASQSPCVPAVITVRPSSFSQHISSFRSVLSINMKDTALHGKLIEDSMLWPFKWKDNVKPITRSSNFYRCIKLRNGLSLEQRGVSTVTVSGFSPL